MKALFILFIGFASVWQPTTKILQEAFKHASESKVKAQTFYDEAQKLEEGSEQKQVFLGAALVTLAKFEKGLKHKMDLTKQGAEMLEAGIAKDPQNVAYRLVRLIIQENVPKIVGYRKDIETDKAFIKTHFSEQSEDLKAWIRDYAKSSDSFEAEDFQ